MQSNINNNEIKTETNGSTDTVAPNHLGDIKALAFLLWEIAMPLFPFAFLFEFGDGACKYGKMVFSLLLLLKCIFGTYVSFFFCGRVNFSVKWHAKVSRIGFHAYL